MTGVLDLAAVLGVLREHPHVREKLAIAAAYQPALPAAGEILLGDDTAAIPDGDGYLLFAGEGMMESFIAKDPWFAGYCAVMVNLSDIAAMGGRPTAIVDLLWAHERSPEAALLWAGMNAASLAYGVPIVGGHTARLPLGRTPLLGAAVVGRAKSLISSFTADTGDVILMAVDMRAEYRGDGTLFWNASTAASAERLRGDLELLPELSEAGLVTAGKDISNGGVLGTLAMLLATSACGAVVDIDSLPMPPGVALERWLLSFPSFGYLLTTKPESVKAVRRRFESRGITCEPIGTCDATLSLRVCAAGECQTFTAITPARAAGGPSAHRATSR